MKSYIKESPKVSIIIPVYNGEETLRQCLKSVLNQPYKNYEVIVVNNNSTDRTKDIIKEFQKKDKKVKYVFEKYRSRGAAMNAGIKVAKGVIIAITGADCIVPQDWIEKIIRPITKGNYSVVVGFTEIIGNNYWSRNLRRSERQYFNLCRRGKNINHIATGNFAIRKEIILKNMFDKKLEALEDFDLYLRLKDKFKIRYFPEVKVTHYHHERMKDVIKMIFQRGASVPAIISKHNKCKIMNELMLKNFRFKKWIILPFWLSFQLLKNPKRFPYLFLTETCWRLGYLSKRYLN